MASTQAGQTETVLTIHSLRQASGGVSPTYPSVCSCNAAALQAEGREVWRHVGGGFKE